MAVIDTISRRQLVGRLTEDAAQWNSPHAHVEGIAREHAPALDVSLSLSLPAVIVWCEAEGSGSVPVDGAEFRDLGKARPRQSAARSASYELVTHTPVLGTVGARRIPRWPIAQTINETRTDHGHRETAGVQALVQCPVIAAGHLDDDLTPCTDFRGLAEDVRNSLRHLRLSGKSGMIVNGS